MAPSVRRARYYLHANPIMNSPRHEGNKPTPQLELATILVGPFRVMFKIPVETLTKHSPFFTKALLGKFKEAETKVVELPDDEPKSFSCFANWACGLEANVSFVGISDSEMRHHMKIHDLANVWIFAEKIRVAPFQNFVMDRILERYKDYHGTNISVNTFNHVYDNTMAGSQLRHVLVDFAAHKMSPSWYNMNKGQLELDFLEEMCLAHMMTRDRFTVGRTPGSENKLHSFLYYVRPDQTEEEVATEIKAEIERSKAPQSHQATPEELEKRTILMPHSVKRRVIQVLEL